MSVTIPAWSYSSLSTYEQCPRKYKYIYVDKNREPESEAIRYGNELHKAAELHIKDLNANPMNMVIATPAMKCAN